MSSFRVEFISGGEPFAYIQPVDESCRLIPINATSRTSGTICIDDIQIYILEPYIEVTCRVGQSHHLAGNFIFAQRKSVWHRTYWIRATCQIWRVAGIPDRDKFQIKRILARAKPRYPILRKSNFMDKKKAENGKQSTRHKK